MMIDYTSLIRQADDIIRKLPEAGDMLAGRLSVGKAEENSTKLVSDILQEALGERVEEVVDILKKTISSD